MWYGKNTISIKIIYKSNYKILFRVPADKHPEIAPTEFANFIKTHGANTPSRNNSTLHRRKSILSQSLSVSPKYNNEEEEDDEIELNRTLSEKKRHFLEKVMNDKGKIK
jgi:hypothetical protein